MLWTLQTRFFRKPHRFVYLLVIVPAATVLVGCTSIPRFHGSDSAKDAPTVAELVTHIQCEIWNIVTEGGKSDWHTNALATHQYVAFANLTVDVTNFEGTSPSLSFIAPYQTPMTNLTKSVSGQWTGTQHRSINQTFSLNIQAPNEAYAHEHCLSPGKDGARLHGDLGLAAIIKAGLAHVEQPEFVFKRPGSTDPTKLSSTAPVFGSTIDFTIVYGIGNIGPTWTLTHFKGPGGGSGSGSGSGGSSQGLLTLTRTEKDTLVISFAPACPDGGCPQKDNTAAAAPAAAQSTGAEVGTTLKKEEARLPQLPAKATPAEKANFAATQALLNATAALTEAVNGLKRQSEAQVSATFALSTVETGPSASQLATKAAQDNTTRMILQNLLTSP